MSAAENRPLRILLIIDTYPPVLGGSEIEAQRVSSALIQRGHSVLVLCAGGPIMPQVREWVDPEGVPVKILTRKSTGRLKDMTFALEVAAEIWKGRHDFDIVYFLMQGLQVAAGLPVARLLGKATVLKIAGSGVIDLMKRSRAGRVELRWLRDWRVPLMVLNEGMTQEALKEGFRTDQIIWMPNPVDIQTFRPALDGEIATWRTLKQIPLSATVVIYVGRLSHEKGVAQLLRGFAQMMRNAPDALLVLVGDGPMRKSLEDLARSLDPEMKQIRFEGRAPIKEVPCWLRASDVFALTSPNEGFPCALVEAMAAGLPSLASSIPANLQLVDDGVHGVTVPFADIDAIGNGLAALIGDRDARQRMGLAARQRAADNYSTDKVLSLYEDTFRRILATNAQQPGIQ